MSGVKDGLVEVKLPNRLWDKLDKLQETTITTKSKVEILEDQNEEQFRLIRETSKQVNVNAADIANLKNHRKGKNLLARFLMKVFLGSV